MKNKASDEIGRPALGMATLGTKYTFVSKVHKIELQKSVDIIDSYQVVAKRLEYADETEKTLHINKDYPTGKKGFFAASRIEEGIKNKELGDPILDVDDACKLMIKEKEKDLKELKKLNGKVEKLIEFYEADIKDKTDNGLQYDKEGKLINVVVAPEL